MVQLLCLYAPEDARHHAALRQHLAEPIRQGVVTLLDVASVSPGLEVEAETAALLTAADVVVPLITARLLANDRCVALVEHAVAAGRSVVPVRLSHVTVKGSVLEGLQALPRSGEPILARRKADQDQPWLEVVDALCQRAEGGAASQLAPAAAQSERWHVPAPGPYFTGRDEEIAALRKALLATGRSAVGQVQAVSGLGGIGKTQLALGYARHHAADYAAGFFVRADTDLALRAGLGDVVKRLRLPVGPDPAELVPAIRRWLEIEEGGLLILDNVEDLALVKGLCAPGLKAHVLITTRLRNLRALRVERVVLDGLRPAASLALLLERTGREDADDAERAAAAAIAEEVGRLPLALEQAGAYIAAREMPIGRYLTALRERRTEVLRVMPETGDYPASVATTWTLNMEQVRQESEAAAALIELSAFLAPDAIPEELLVEGAHELGPVLGQCLAVSVDDVLAPLLRYSLIERDLAEHTYQVHRLVQAIVRDQLDAPSRRKWAARVVCALDVVFPSGAYETWAHCRRLICHISLVAEMLADLRLTGAVVGRVLNRAGEYLRQQADYLAADRLSTQALAITETVLGPDHPRVAPICNDLAALYQDEGKYAAAELLYLRSLAINTKALVPDHPKIAAVCNNLAGLYQDQGKYDAAELLYLRAQAINEQALGQDHLAVATNCNNLAGLYQAQGKYDAAESLLLRALAISETTLGSDHPEVAATYNNLAELYQDQGKYVAAEPLYRRALAINEKTLGSDHPLVATNCNNLASLHQVQGKYDAAEPLYLRALAIREKALGPDHPVVATTYNNLAALYKDQGKYAAAEPLYLRDLLVREKALGPGHPTVAATCDNLAGLYAAQGNHDAAEPLYRRAVAIKEKALGPDHPTVAQTYNNLAGLYQAQGKYDQAEPLYRRALTVAEKTLPPDHPSVAATCNNLARLYQAQGRYDAAVPLYLRDLAISEKALDPDHPTVAATCDNLAGIFRAQGKYDQAEPVYIRVLALREKALGPDHPAVVQTCNDLAGLYQAQGKYDQAEPLYLRVLALQQSVLGPYHPYVASTSNNLAGLYQAQGKYNEAEPLYLRALALCEKVLGPDHPVVARACNNLAGLYQDQGRQEAAAPLLARAAAIQARRQRPATPAG